MKNKPYPLWDKLFKIVTDCYPKQVVDFVLPGENIKLLEKYEQERIVLQYQIADINFWIEDGGKKKLLNIEPYSEWSSSIPAKVFTRNAIITKSLKHKHKVISVAVILDNKCKLGKYKVKLGTNMINTFSFPVLNLSDVKKILKNYPALAPFVLKFDKEHQEQAIEVVKKDKTLSVITVLILSRIGFSQEEALKMTGVKLQEFKQALSEVPIMQTMFKELDEKAKKELDEKVKIERTEGEKQGERQGKLTVAKNMLKEKLKVDLICKVTGLSEVEVKELNKPD